MVALDNSAIVVRFAALDNLSHVAVDLEHPLFSWYLGSIENLPLNLKGKPLN